LDAVVYLPFRVHIRPDLERAIGILAALYRRRDTGQGERIEIAMQDAMLQYIRVALSMAVVMSSLLSLGCWDWLFTNRRCGRQ
jgi:hypothetical protein